MGEQHECLVSALLERMPLDAAVSLLHDTLRGLQTIEQQRKQRSQPPPSPPPSPGGSSARISPSKIRTNPLLEPTGASIAIEVAESSCHAWEPPVQPPPPSVTPSAAPSAAAAAPPPPTQPARASEAPAANPRRQPSVQQEEGEEEEVVVDDEDESSDSGVEGEEGGAAAPPLPPQPAPRQSTQPDPPPTTAPPAAEHRAAPVAPAYGSGERQRPKTAPARTAAHSALATIRMQKDLAKKQRREERDKSERARQNELERVKAMTMHDMLESVAIGGSGRKKKLLFLTGEQADQIVQSSTSIDAMLRAFEVGAPRHASSHPPPPLTFSPAIHLPTLSTSLLHPPPFAT